MRLFFVLALGGIFPLGSLSAFQSSHSASKTAAKKSAAKKSAAPKSSSAKSSSKSSRSRTVKRGRRARSKPKASFQLHPEPERYAEIQRALAQRGYFKGEANGEWKDDSVDALRRFQTDQKLPDDGKIGALSLTALGLGPRHDGTTASTAPAPSSEPPPPPQSSDRNSSPPPSH